MTNDSKAMLEDQLNQLADQGKKVDESSGEVADAFDTLITGLKVTGWATGALGLGLGGVLTAEYAESRRDEILSGISTLQGKLSEAIEGAAAPFKFIDDAAEWGKIKASIIEANNDAGKQTLNGYWEGFAFDRYDSAAAAQMDAALSAAMLCDAIITNLEEMAQYGLDFYFGVVKAVTSYVTSMAAAIAKIATVIEAPWGISDAIDLVAAIVDTFVDLADLATKFIRDQLISANKLAASAQAQDGLPNRRWPKATSDEYDDKEAWEYPA